MCDFFFSQRNLKALIVKIKKSKSKIKPIQNTLIKNQVHFVYKIKNLLMKKII